MLQMEAMVERLYTHHPPRGIQTKGRPKPMKMTCYIENGVHSYRLEEIAAKPNQERTDFMVCFGRPLTMIWGWTTVFSM